MVPTVLFGYFVLLLAVMLVITSAVAWYWGVALVAGFVFVERTFFRESHALDGDDDYDIKHDGPDAHAHHR